MRKVCSLLLAMIFLSVGLTSCSKTAEHIGAEADYIVIHSRSREESSGIFCIDSDGDVTEKLKNSKMQDLSFFSFNDEKLIVSGGRKNNNMLFDLKESGVYSEVHWLNNPQYSGVTAVELLNDSVLAIMNGNYTDTTYLNLLVEQDYDGDVIQQTEIELYTRDVVADSSTAKLVGKHLSKTGGTNEWKASIIDYNVAEQEITQQYYYAEYNCFWEILETDSVIYCLAENKNERINTICAISKITFEIKSQLQIEDQLCGMYLDGNTLYVVGNKSLYNIHADTLTKEQAYSHDTTVSGYVDWAYEYSGHYYVMFRYDQRVKDGNVYEYGLLLKTSLDTFDKAETPIRYDKRTTIDDCVIFPREMFEK